METLSILTLVTVVMVTDCMTNASTNSLSDLIKAMQNSSLFASDSRQGRQMVQRFGSRVSLNQLTRAALGPVYSQPSTPGLPRGPPVNVQVNRITRHDPAKDSQQITGGPFLTPPVPLGGNFDLSLNARPPSPPPPTVSPPAPPPSPSTLPPPISVSTPSTRRPSPSPQPGQSRVLASDIRCMRSTSREQLRATITSSRPLVAPPVLVLRPEVNPLTSSVCSVLTESEQQLSLTVSNLDACGVETCRQPNGENWLCLTVRFPVIAGIQLPEDDVIQIQCRPQDRSHTVDKQLNVAATGYDQLTASAFIGDVQQFQCEVALFRRTPGSDLFSTLVKADDVITLGEEIHLRSIVRAGDGWEYSKLTDVLVQKLSQDGDTQTTTSIPLLFNDGCRNQVYQLLAPQQPARHQKTQLITNFPFRVFAFQGMTSGDRLQVTARVTGCIEAIDCAPTACSDGGRGFGRRRRDVDGSRHQRHRNNVTNWNRDMAFSVVLPDFTNLPREASPTMSGSMSGCPAYLLGSLLSALVFCLLLLGFAVYAFNVRRSHQLRKLAAAGDFTQLAPHCGGHTDYESQRPPLDVAVIGPDRAGRFCTVRQAKRRGLRMRRSFSTGNLSSRCTCRGAAGAPDSHVSVVQIPAEENIYCELATRCDVQPTMV